MRNTVLLALATLLAPTARAEEGPDPASVRIESERHNGTGCRSGTASVNLSPDRRALTIVFGEYAVATGDQGNPNRVKKSCDIDLRVTVPDTWTFALFTIDWRGYASLEPGTSGTLESRISFPPGSGMTRLATKGFTSPFDGDFQHRTEVPLAARAFAPCGGPTRTLKLKTDLGIETPRGTQALISLDATDGELSNVYGIAWKRCR